MSARLRAVILAMSVSAVGCRAAPRSASEVDCLNTSGRVHLEVLFGYHPEFGGETSSNLVVDVGRSPTIAGYLWGRTVGPVAVTDDVARRSIREVITALRRAERDSGCLSSGGAFARVSFACGGQQTFVEVQTSSCDPSVPEPPFRRRRRPIDRGYARAHGVIGASESILRGTGG
jgi:hypothetical protein